jgi:glycosyltransferase involved in cell wall biosynthesis
MGGRLQVILGIVKALNGLGLEPDILTLGTSFDQRDILSKYGQELRMRIRPILGFLPWRYLPQDYQILFFNFLLRYFCDDYQLLIDSGNSQIFLPSKKNILSYVHYPRESRIIKSSDEVEHPISIRSLFNLLSARFLHVIYRFAKMNLDHAFVCNSNFTQQALLECYPDLRPESVRMIYPPVNISSYSKSKSQSRQNSVISLGRFSPDKKQLEQIKIAQSLPDIEFHLVGFVNNNKYFKQCEEFIRVNRIENVTLHPDATQTHVIELLGRSKYFLHVLENEPFGITTVEAIAAGCIPLVHDSGGQRETVPSKSLRFTDIHDIPLMISKLEGKDQNQIKILSDRLFKRAKDNFDERVFHGKISQLLIDILG